MSEVTVFTVGHGVQPLDDLVETLSAAAIEILIDVRSMPYSSRNRQFNKESIEGASRRAGIEYRWMPALGGKPSSPALWAAPGVPDYKAMSEESTFCEHIDLVINEARNKRVALMCSETRPDECHRSRLLGPPLIEKGCTVIHLLPGGRTADVAASRRML